MKLHLWLGSLLLGTATAAELRQTSGDTVQQPSWQHRLTVTVGPGADADIRGTTEKALQAAVDYVSRHGGGTVEIQEGAYRLRNSVFLTSRLRLVGKGAKTVLIKEPSVTTTVAADSDWFDQEITLTDATGFQLGDGVCLRTKDPKTGVQEVLKRTLVARTGSRFKLDKALRKNVWRYNSGTVSTLFPILSGEFIEDVVIENLVLDGNRAHNAELDGNYAGCVFLQDCNRITMRGLHARNYNGDGLSWQICHDVLVENCVSEGHSGLGLHPGSGSQRPIMRNNVLRNNRIGLFFCWGVRNGIAEANDITGNRIGISIGHHDTHNLVTRNTVTGSQEVGIIFRPERGPEFAGHRNRIEANVLRDNGDGKGAAIDVQGGTEGVQIIGNTIEDSRAPATAAIRLGMDTKDIRVDKNVVKGFGQEIEQLTRSQSP
jgi:hypothetical protein